MNISVGSDILKGSLRSIFYIEDHKTRMAKVLQITTTVKNATNPNPEICHPGKSKKNGVREEAAVAFLVSSKLQ